MTAVTLAPAWLDDDFGYSAFYSRYHGPLTSYLRMGFRDADVEAVVQETFCRALARWNEVGNMSAPWPWLAVTARNLALNNIRDEKSSQAAGLEVFEETECSGADVAEQVEAADTLRTLAQAMSVLTPLQRRLVTVMVEEGLTGAQLARRLGMRPGAVRMHLCRMRLRLGERFASLGGALGVAPVAVLAVLRRFRVKSQSVAGAVPVTLSAVATAVGIVVIGVLPSAPFLDNGAGGAAQVVSGTHITKAASMTRERAVTARTAHRQVVPVVHRAAPRQVVASTDTVNVAGEVSTTGSLAVEKRGGAESPRHLVERCLNHATVTLTYIGCEASGNGTQ